MMNGSTIKKSSSISFSVLFIMLITEMGICEEGFNIQLEITQNYRTISPGDSIPFSIKVMNLVNQERKDISLLYEIVDDANNSIASKTETMAIETQASFVGELAIPEEAREGKYYLRAELVSDTGKYSEIQIEVIKEKSDPKIWYVLSIFIVLFALLSVFCIKKVMFFVEEIQLSAKIDKIVKKRLH